VRTSSTPVISAVPDGATVAAGVGADGETVAAGVAGADVGAGVGDGRDAVGAQAVTSAAMANAASRLVDGNIVDRVEPHQRRQHPMWITFRRIVENSRRPGERVGRIDQTREPRVLPAP
jgi:hypothetical protein